ncbi:MAG TPA: hypothetical protein PKD90_02900 [Phnomibacter sp.]|nr:hypothetical protein [Phnomibacter sp.]
MEHTLHLAPRFGLCNRIRAIHAAIGLSQHLNRPLKIYWIKSNGLAAPYTNLFKNTTAFSLVECKRLPLIMADGGPRQWYLPNLVRKVLRTTYFSTGHMNTIARSQISLKTLIPANKPVYLSSNSNFFDNESPLHWLQPQDYLQERIDTFTQPFTAFTLGLHIRRTDHLQATKHSPLPLFFEKIDRHFDLYDNANCYIATDCQEVKLKMVARYGNRIISSPQQAVRNSLEGMRHAVVELFALSRTSTIIGSYLSSFSEVAAAIGGIPLTEVYTQAQSLHKHPSLGKTA